MSHLSVEKWQKMQMYYDISENMKDKFRMMKVEKLDISICLFCWQIVLSCFFAE